MDKDRKDYMRMGLWSLRISKAGISPLGTGHVATGAFVRPAGAKPSRSDQKPRS